jgi:hypothetical protein
MLKTARDRRRCIAEDDIAASIRGSVKAERNPFAHLRMESHPAADHIALR